MTPLVSNRDTTGVKMTPESGVKMTPYNDIYNKDINKDTLVPVTTGTAFCQDFIKTFNKLFNTNYQLTRGREEKLRLRLKTYKQEQILAALTNLSRSSFHRGKNDRSWVADPDFLIRSDEQIDRWLNTAASSVAKPRFRLSDLIKEASKHANN
jgi:hypothetical protein